MRCAAAVARPATMRSPRRTARSGGPATSKDRLRVEFARIRANGWAVSEQQLELEYRGVAVPLLDHHGDLVGGLNVSMPIGHESSEDAAKRVLPVPQETSRAMHNLI